MGCDSPWLLMHCVMPGQIQGPNSEEGVISCQQVLITVKCCTFLR